MIIQLDPRTRIVGLKLDWRVEKLISEGKEMWNGTNYFNSLENALLFAFEKRLVKSDEAVATLEDYVDELNRCKGELMSALRAASV